jgi:hypothetical protein
MPGLDQLVPGISPPNGESSPIQPLNQIIFPIRIDLVDRTAIPAWNVRLRETRVWRDQDHVVLDLHWPEVAIVSAESWERHHLGYLDELYLSQKYMFASYGDEAFYSSRPNEVESNIISIFLQDGTFELGIRALLDKDRNAWKFEQVTAGYTFKDEFRFIAWDSPLLWILNVSERSWRKLPGPFSFGSIAVLSENDEKAYGIFDHRAIKSHYPELPLFALAVFDFVAETAWMQDFAPVESALIAAGFSMNETKLQPSATGKIIVSDNGKAPFLEFSGLA